MSLDSRIVFESELLRLRRVLCCPQDLRCSDVEYPRGATMVLPLSGIFIKHVSPHTRIVCDAQHAVFFNPGEPYRVSHPVHGGDISLAIDFPDDTLRDLLVHGGARGHRGTERPFAATHGRLNFPAIAVKRLLWHRLAHGVVGSLEAEESVLDLFRLTGNMLETRSASPPTHRCRSREGELVEATKITLATSPQQRWTLDQLGRRVYASPYHLARIFRRRTGLSIHQYHLLARLTRTLDAVLDTSDDLGRIALDAGFASHSHFTAAFRKAYGTTPAGLRSRALNRPVRLRDLTSAVPT